MDNKSAGDDRDQSAEARDERADAHDQVSDTRDHKADERDARAEAREEREGVASTGAAGDRAGALRDRRGGADDRSQAADDRDASASDRTLAGKDRASSSLDGLTGAYRREAGILELERAIDKAQRMKERLVLTFIDVNGLKDRNDGLGHAAGDQLLRQTVEIVRTHLRSYDLIVRYGGDEFVCLLDLGTSEAAKRFEDVSVDLAELEDASISVGLAEMRPEDSLEDLIARADQALYTQRRGHGSAP
jgi:diguanylate cyclase (GGDEF)-like protein